MDVAVRAQHPRPRLSAWAAGICLVGALVVFAAPWTSDGGRRPGGVALCLLAVGAAALYYARAPLRGAGLVALSGMLVALAVAVLVLLGVGGWGVSESQGVLERRLVTSSPLNDGAGTWRARCPRTPAERAGPEFTCELRRGDAEVVTLTLAVSDGEAKVVDAAYRAR